MIVWQNGRSNGSDNNSNKLNPGRHYVIAWVRGPGTALEIGH